MEHLEGKVVTINASYECKPLDIRICQTHITTLLRALKWLHKKNILHCDIKPDNILLGSNKAVYLVDFGVSLLINTSAYTYRGLGTRNFQAPDLLMPASSASAGEEENRSTTNSPLVALPPALEPTQKNKNLPAGDIWALGVTFYVFLFGTLPFIGVTPKEICANIKKALLSDEMKHEVLVRRIVANHTKLRAALDCDPDDELECAAEVEALANAAVALLLKMLVQEPTARITAAQALDEPFIRRTTS